MKHFWINIDKNEERRSFMTDQYKKMKLEHYRVPAITPNDFDELLVQKRPLTCKHPGCNTCEYEFACLCSHIKAIQEGLKSNDEYFVIMEDDIVIPSSINYEEMLKNVPDDMEILQLLILYGNTVVNLAKFYMHTKQICIKWQYLFPSTGMYIISRTGAQKLVELFYDKNENKYDFGKSPYQIVADVLLYQSVNTYATTIPYAYPNSEMGSEIHPDHLSAQQDAILHIKHVLNTMQNIPFTKAIN